MSCIIIAHGQQQHQQAISTAQTGVCDAIRGLRRVGKARYGWVRWLDGDGGKGCRVESETGAILSDRLSRGSSSGRERFRLFRPPANQTTNATITCWFSGRKACECFGNMRLTSREMLSASLSRFMPCCRSHQLTTSSSAFSDARLVVSS